MLENAFWISNIVLAFIAGHQFLKKRKAQDRNVLQEHRLQREALQQDAQADQYRDHMQTILNATASARDNIEGFGLVAQVAKMAEYADDPDLDPLGVYRVYRGMQNECDDWSLEQRRHVDSLERIKLMAPADLCIRVDRFCMALLEFAEENVEIAHSSALPEEQIPNLDGPKARRNEQYQIMLGEKAVMLSKIKAILTATHI